MLETLTQGFRQARARLSGQTTLTEDSVGQAMRDIRMSLLEADVDFNVTKRFLEHVKEKALGESLRLETGAGKKKLKITPADRFIKICYDELINLMGPAGGTINWASKGPTMVMMVGLQGSGKTTTCGKLAKWFQKQGKKPLLVAADVYRPAAIEQLKVIGEKTGTPVYAEDSPDPPAICENGLAHAKSHGYDAVIFDTAGRLAIDEPLMAELNAIDTRCRPQNTLLIVDAMIGQDAVKTAAAFHDRLKLTGFIMTKLDGDTRGGAALSIKEVTGAPIKFAGMGEDLNALDEFRPDGLASRILGYGDIVGLVQEFEDAIANPDEAEADAMRMLSGQFTLDDFLKQIEMLRQVGPLTSILEKMPLFPDGMPEGVKIDDQEFTRISAMIRSMTKTERRHPEIIDDARLTRIAAGSGRKEFEVRGLIQRFEMMATMMKQLGELGPSFLTKMPGFGQMDKIKDLQGIDIHHLFGMESPEEIARRQSFSGIRKKATLQRKKEKHKRKQQKQARRKNR